jgi:nucleotide-binding universal stress UspA family protein
VNADLWSILFDLGAHLAPDDASLATYVHEALPSPNLGLATRIALAALGRTEHLLVLDDFDAAADRVTAGFLAEAAARVPSVRIVTAGRTALRSEGVPSLRIPPFTARDTSRLLALRRLPQVPARELHAFTGGDPRLLDLAARWLRAVPGADATAAATALKQATRADRFLLSSCARAVARRRPRAA